VNEQSEQNHSHPDTCANGGGDKQPGWNLPSQLPQNIMSTGSLADLQTVHDISTGCVGRTDGERSSFRGTRVRQGLCVLGSVHAVDCGRCSGSAFSLHSRGGVCKALARLEPCATGVNGRGVAAIGLQGFVGAEATLAPPPPAAAATVVPPPPPLLVLVLVRLRLRRPRSPLCAGVVQPAAVTAEAAGGGKRTATVRLLWTLSFAIIASTCAASSAALAAPRTARSKIGIFCAEIR
jgi:hypothetical protein